MNIDRRVLDLLSQWGSHLNKAHDFNFYLYFGSEKNALLARTVMEREDFEVDVMPPDSSPDWLVLGYKTMIPDESELIEIRNWFESIAEVLNGRYDGWETAVVE